MREIKFKALIRKYDEWWNLAGYVVDENKKRIRVFRMNDEMPDGMSTEVFDLRDVEIVQFTGLKDANGVEIFEGDIVETPQHKYIKKWVVDENHGGAFVLSNRLNTETYLDSDTIGMTIVDNCYHPDMSVIGNIHENYELLEQ